MLPEQEYEFLDYTFNPHWVIDKSIKLMKNITDDFVTGTVQENELLFGAYFFYSENMQEHERKAMDYMSLFSNIGGLQALLMSIFTIFG